MSLRDAMATRIGACELEGELGRGGMGRVSRARHLPTGAVRALKVLLEGGDPESVARFRREAESLARAGGRGVVPIHDFGVEGRQVFLVMSLLAGGSLRQRLEGAGKLPWSEATARVSKLARTLELDRAKRAKPPETKPDTELYKLEVRVLVMTNDLEEASRVAERWRADWPDDRQGLFQSLRRATSRARRGRGIPSRAFARCARP